MAVLQQVTITASFALDCRFWLDFYFETLQLKNARCSFRPVEGHDAFSKHWVPQFASRGCRY